MKCIKCGDLVPAELYSLTGREKCLKCTIRAYKFVIRKLHKEVEELEELLEE